MKKHDFYTFIYDTTAGKGFQVKLGKCAGNDLTAVAANLHLCEKECRQRAACKGFDYDYSTSKCELKTVGCEGPTSYPNTLSFSMNGTSRFLLNKNSL